MQDVCVCVCVSANINTLHLVKLSRMYIRAYIQVKAQNYMIVHSTNLTLNHALYHNNAVYNY